jgi:hypothetical protein
MVHAIEAFDAMSAFAAAHESESGTNRTNWAGLMMSAVRGRSDVTGRGLNDANGPFSDIELLHREMRDGTSEYQLQLTRLF